MKQKVFRYFVYILLYHSDNGGNVNCTGSNWPYRGGKTTHFEGGIRAAAFVHSAMLPDRVRGTVSNAFTHVSDWFPTIVSSVAGGDLSETKPLDGFDIWSVIL